MIHSSLGKITLTRELGVLRQVHNEYCLFPSAISFTNLINTKTPPSVGGHPGINGSYISGVLLVIILCVMLPFAHSCVRRRGQFSVRRFENMSIEQPSL